MVEELILIDRATKNDIYAFEELVHPYTKPLYNYVLRILKNHQDAEDALQETYIKVYNSLNLFEGSSSFKTWLYKIATNVCLDRLRKQKNESNISLNKTTDKGEYEIQIPDDTYSPEIKAIKNAALDAVYVALEKLPEDQKIAVSLRDIDGLSYDEIADITESTLGTVKSRINRARHQLKKLLEKNRELFH